MMGRRLRILHVLGSSRIGGTETSVFRLVEGMSDGFENEACFLSVRGPVGERFERIGVRVRYLPMVGLLGSLRSFFRFARLLRSGAFDVVHGYGLRANLLGRMLGPLSPCTRVLGGLRSTHPSGRKRGFHLWIDRMTFGRSHGYVSNSQAAIDRLVSLGYPRDRFWLIHNGIDLTQPARIREIGVEALRSRHDLPVSRPVLISTANLRPAKDHATLLRAMAKLKDRGTAPLLLLAGEGPLRGELEALVCALGLKACVRFLGSVPNQKVLELEAAADAVVLSSHVEGLPTSLIEAMSVGTPVIATDVGGVSEVVDDGVTGLVVPPRDVEALATAIASLIDDPEKRERMGRAAAEQAAGLFSLTRAVREHEELYRRLAGIDNGKGAGVRSQLR